jgi:DNA-binding NarL/FixJ family response regulator
MQITITFDEGNSKQFTVIQDKKNYRRKKILELVAKGYKQKEIAAKIGCSLSTIEREMKEIRESEMIIE